MNFLKETVLLKLSQMIERIRNDEEYFNEITEEKPIYYGTQSWIGQENEFVRLDLRISKDKIKV